MQKARATAMDDGEQILDNGQHCAGCPLCPDGASMGTASPKSTPSDEAQAAMVELLGRIQPFACARRLWTRVLTNAERERLGGDFDTCFQQHGTVGMWRKIHGGSK